MGEEEEVYQITKEGLDTIMSWARMKAQVWEMAGADENDMDLDTQVAILLPFIIIPFYEVVKARDGEWEG